VDISFLGIGVAALSFGLGYGFRRISLKWEDRAKVATRRADLRAEQLQATVSASLDGIIVIDANGDIVDFSESAERIFGYKSAEIVGKSMAELIVPERYRTAHSNGMKRMRETGQAKIIGQRIEIEAMRADGSEFMSELAISRSSSENGDIFIAYIRDISDRIAAKNDLVDAKEAAEAASEAKSRFLATMSHEIRTPFNAVLGILDILGDTKLNKEQHHLVKTAESSSVALLRVINDVLDYARMSSGQATLLAHPFRANSVFDDVIELFKSQVEDKGLSLELHVNEDHDEVYLKGDIGRIRQILLNFVSNAIKFTDKGKLELEIDLDPQTNRQYRLQCSVKDTGIGIDEDVLQKLFDEFFMADDTATRKFEGTGLGLTISKNIAELMGGEIGCESEPGKGSRFWVSIPLSLSSKKAANARYQGKNFDMTNTRILVAEDNPTNQMVIRHTLEKRCAELRIVENGAEAIKALESGEFDLVLMDIFMPKMNGREAVKLIRASNNKHKNVPVIALTAMGSFQDLDSLRSDGVDEVVTKPFKKEDLFAAITSVMGDNKDGFVTKDLEFGGFASELDFDEIPRFKEQLGKDLIEIRGQLLKFCADKDWAELSQPTHTLKGLAGTYGMECLAKIAEKTNELIKTGDFSSCDELCGELADQLENYIESLDQLFNRLQEAA